MTRRLGGDRRGATLVEFGLVAPVLLIAMMGFFDVGHSLYLRTALEGQLQKSARDATLESGMVRFDALDNDVRAQVRNLVSDANVKFSRRYYRTFSTAAAARGEEFTDTNRDGRCNAGEPYVDANNNRQYDSDGGDSVGGAKDIMVYTVNVDYPRLFPMAGLIGLPQRAATQARVVIANQPYGDQGSYGAPTVRNCT